MIPEHLTLLKAKLVEVISSSLGEFASLPGEVFSSGLDTLVPGPLYVMGLNPGSGESYLSISEHVERWNFTNYSAFLDQCWNPDCWNRDSYGRQESLGCNCHRGTNAQQVSTRNIVERTLPGVEIRSVFATNAIFAASKAAKSFQKETRYTLRAAWHLCWPVHAFMLSIVRPQIIICLGYDASGSAFSLLRGTCQQMGDVQKHLQPGRKYASFKWCKITLPPEAGGIDVLLVGVRHPAYVGNAVEVPEYHTLISGHLSSNIAVERDAQQAVLPIASRPSP